MRNLRSSGLPCNQIKHFWNDIRIGKRAALCATLRMRGGMSYYNECAGVKGANALQTTPRVSTNFAGICGANAAARAQKARSGIGKVNIHWIRPFMDTALGPGMRRGDGCSPHRQRGIAPGGKR